MLLIYVSLRFCLRAASLPASVPSEPEPAIAVGAGTGDEDDDTLSYFAKLAAD